MKIIKSLFGRKRDKKSKKPSGAPELITHPAHIGTETKSNANTKTNTKTNTISASHHDDNNKNNEKTQKSKQSYVKNHSDQKSNVKPIETKDVSDIKAVAMNLPEDEARKLPLEKEPNLITTPSKTEKGIEGKASENDEEKSDTNGGSPSLVGKNVGEVFVPQSGIDDRHATVSNAYDSIPLLEQTKLPRGGISVETAAIGRVQVRLIYVTHGYSAVVSVCDCVLRFLLFQFYQYFCHYLRLSNNPKILPFFNFISLVFLQKRSKIVCGWVFLFRKYILYQQNVFVETWGQL